MFESFRRPSKDLTPSARGALAGAAMLGMVSGADANVDPHSVDEPEPITIEQTVDESTVYEFSKERDFLPALEILTERFDVNRENITFVSATKIEGLSVVIVTISISNIDGVREGNHSFQFNLGDGFTDALTEELIKIGVLPTSK